MQESDTKLQAKRTTRFVGVNYFEQTAINVS